MSVKKKLLKALRNQASHTAHAIAYKFWELTIPFLSENEAAVVDTAKEQGFCPVDAAINFCEGFVDHATQRGTIPLTNDYDKTMFMIAGARFAEQVGDSVNVHDIHAIGKQLLALQLRYQEDSEEEGEEETHGIIVIRL